MVLTIDNMVIVIYMIMIAIVAMKTSKMKLILTDFFKK